MNSPDSEDPTIVSIAQALGRVEGKVDLIQAALLPLTLKLEAHEKAINQSRGVLAALSALWVMTVAGIGIALGFFRR